MFSVGIRLPVYAVRMGSRGHVSTYSFCNLHEAKYHNLSFLRVGIRPLRRSVHSTCIANE